MAKATSAVGERTQDDVPGVCKASSQAPTAEVRNIENLSERKLQEHIRLEGARLVQQRCDIEIRRWENEITQHVVHALKLVIIMAKSGGNTRNFTKRETSGEPVKERDAMPEQMGTYERTASTACNKRAIVKPCNLCVRRQGQKDRDMLVPSSAGRVRDKLKDVKTHLKNKGSCRGSDETTDAKTSATKATSTAQSER